VPGDVRRSKSHIAASQYNKYISNYRCIIEHNVLYNSINRSEINAFVIRVLQIDLVGFRYVLQFQKKSQYTVPKYQNQKHVVQKSQIEYKNVVLYFNILVSLSPEDQRCSIFTSAFNLFKGSAAKFRHRKSLLQKEVGRYFLIEAMLKLRS
jgi:hypothetical protein